jgi:hypothetical protein
VGSSDILVQLTEAEQHADELECVRLYFGVSSMLPKRIEHQRDSA